MEKYFRTAVIPNLRTELDFEAVEIHRDIVLEVEVEVEVGVVVEDSLLDWVQVLLHCPDSTHRCNTCNPAGNLRYLNEKRYETMK